MGARGKGEIEEEDYFLTTAISILTSDMHFLCLLENCLVERGLSFSSAKEDSLSKHFRVSV